MSALFDKLAYSRKAIEDIAWAAGLMIAVFVILWRWIDKLEIVQRWGLIAVACILFLIGCLRFWAWWEKRGVERIPDLLYKLDELTLDYIGGFETPTDTPEQALIELGQLTGMQFEVNALLRAAKDQDMDKARSIMEGMETRYANTLGPNTGPTTDGTAGSTRKAKRGTSQSSPNPIFGLRQIGSLLDGYDIGLSRLKDLEDYRRLYDRIRLLKRRASTARVGASVDQYFNEADGLYSALLASKVLMESPLRGKLLPTKSRATSSLVRPIIETHMSHLIALVAESIETSKDPNRKP